MNNKSINSTSKLTVAEVRTIAMENYRNGGDVVIECYKDCEIQEWINEEGTLEQLKRLFKINKELMSERF